MKPFSKSVFFALLILTQNVFIFCKDTGKEEEKESILDSVVSAVTDSDNIKFGIKTAAVAGIAIAGAPAVLAAAGFGAGGIAAGSLAATYQSTMIGGSILSGSTFAALQSVGAAGLGIVGKATITCVSAAAIKAYEVMSGKSDKNKCNDNENC
ncbi:interferon alpha-inducible protein 27-like protein 2B [Stegodyphus dumicola]|uniref:interferon alpha-inducible protein 27-like protein 2B n=1 Tax=Stegodyphus dumicola TaxID=202533 RepID=UPI0015AE496A|nr:interferon alpha-inducible protein 27-like protein 2B [Stegodyphus dumicola]